MKRVILILVLVASAVLSVSADNFNFLTLQQADVTEQSFNVSGLTITFSDGNMLVSQDGTTTTLSLKDLNKMYFSVTSGIRQPESVATKMETASVYDLQGRKVADNVQLSTINSELPKGVYIVKQGNTSVKIAVK